MERLLHGPDAVTPCARLAVFIALGAGLCAAPATAQDTCPCPPEPKPGWRGGLGAGLSLTSGNTDTRTHNLSLDATYDPKTVHVFRIDGFYLLSATDGVESADRAAAGLRYERKLDGRAFAFGETRFQRDRFKQLASLVTPSVGAGYKLVDRETLTVSADAGAGFAFEKLEDQDATTSGALRAGQTLAWKVSPSATVIQVAAAVWKTDELADAFYHLEVALTTSVARRLELKVSAISDIKNRPATPALQKRDDAFLAALVFKLQ